MKEYNEFYNLGLSIYNNFNRYYFLYYRYHGYYYYSFFTNDDNNIVLNTSKGYYNKGILYSHWKNDYNEKYIFKYYI